MRTLRLHIDIDIPNKVAAMVEQADYQIHDQGPLSLRLSAGGAEHVAKLVGGRLSHQEWKRGHKPDKIFPEDK